MWQVAPVSIMKGEEEGITVGEEAESANEGEGKDSESKTGERATNAWYW